MNNVESVDSTSTVVFSEVGKLRITGMLLASIAIVDLEMNQRPSLGRVCHICQVH